MNRKESEQAKVFEQVKEEKTTQKEAATRLGITNRWVRNKIKRYRIQRDFDLGFITQGERRASTGGTLS